MCAPHVMEAVALSISRRALLASGLTALAGAALAQAPVPGRAFSRAVDLTHELSPEIPLFPGAEPMRITTLVTVRQNGYYGNRLDLWKPQRSSLNQADQLANRVLGKWEVLP
jgi:hypothetical protein